jgi:hypothetical protein
MSSLTYQDHQTSVDLLLESMDGKPKGTLYASVVPEANSTNLDLPRRRRNTKEKMFQPKEKFR